ncbi:hypothetical protein RhiirC2_793236 [Rhizophagus irregularis]|uniref:Uncharacterized protein n=1 Tax=Rhizophagus irregularis TaxID=588596 RepID=A0A2N1MFT1_9GLOM|nr:hypothetical protein RhiirC2_793236 [Rhizophagus irregularis]
MRDARVEELEQKNKELEGTRCCNWTAQNGKQNDILEVTISAVDVPGFLHIPVTEGNDVVPEVLVTVPANSKSSEEKEMDKFLDETHKKNVCDEIRQCDKEKKLLRELAKNQI